MNLQILVEAYKSRRVDAKRLPFGMFAFVVAFSLLPSQSFFLRAQQSATADAPDQNVNIPRGSYQLSCVGIDMRGNSLKAICQTVNENWLMTELHNPESCSDVSNENGNLQCNVNTTEPPGPYQASCKDVVVRNDSLVALCKGVQGKLVRASLPHFRNCGNIENIDGRLTCQGDAASKEVIRELDQLSSRNAPRQPAHWQLHHNTWTFKDGAPAFVWDLAQTSDGFLWLGSSAGLYRFDGRQFEQFQSPFGEELLSTGIDSLYAPPSGGLWIGYTWGGASFVDRGRVKNYGGEFATNSGSIFMMTQDKDGIVWAVSDTSGLWRFENSNWEHIGMEWNVPLKSATKVAVDEDGNLWVDGEGMLLRLRRGSQRFQVVEQKLPPYRLDSGGGLLDREGNLWFRSPRGIDRFFYSPLIKQEVQGVDGVSVAPDDDGTVWVGSGVNPSPLYRIAFGKTQVLPKYRSWYIAFMYHAPDSTFWLGSPSVRGGLWHETLSRRYPSRNHGESDSLFDTRKALWRFTGREWDVVELPPEVAEPGQSLQAITQDRFGGIWVSIWRHGLYRLADGIWTAYGGRKDLKDVAASGVITEFTDSLGRVWFGSNNQAAVLDGDRVQVLGPNDGLRVGQITAISGRGPKIWIGGEFGLEQFDGGHLKNIKGVSNEWLRGISGIVETAAGDLWLRDSSGILHIHQSELAEALKNPSYQVKGDHFGRGDGLASSPVQLQPLASAIEGTDGRLWFALNSDVASVDPARAERRLAPPPITIQSVSADDKAYDPTLPLKVPAHTSSIQINYTAVSLSEPEAVRCRYKLQESDRDWHETASASSVTYRNLPPGSYHFSVAASDTNGNWPGTTAGLEFSILPAFYQTTWFRLSCGAAFLVFLWAVYQLRVQQLQRQFAIGLEARVNERTRIARDLHDTLLQSFQGLMLRLQLVEDLLPQGKAKDQLEQTLQRADQAIAEGRRAVYDLRSSTAVPADLAQAVRSLAEEFATEKSAVFHLVVEGEARDLNPIIRDELYRITCEALRNAFTHARAHRIEAEITYGERAFRLRIRDDGEGIPTQVLEEGRPGHYGLSGMRERAKQIGGKLEFWSKAGVGTEIDLSIPGSIAYRTSVARPLFSFVRKKVG